MSPVAKEVCGPPPFEPCCFCYRSTPYWTALKDRKDGEQVSCCLQCASTREPGEVLTKDIWFDTVTEKFGLMPWSKTARSKLQDPPKVTPAPDEKVLVPEEIGYVAQRAFETEAAIKQALTGKTGVPVRFRRLAKAILPLLRLLRREAEKAEAKCGVEDLARSEKV